MTNSSNDALRNVWESAAPGWAKWEETLSKNLVSVTNILIDGANISPGMKILDLASGAGSQTLMVAERVGPKGQVVACDISGEMLKYLAENAARAGLTNIKTLHRAAEDITPADGRFDAALCRLGLMLFGAPGDALVAIRASLSPGARFAALVFTTPQNNPFIAQPMAIALRCAGKQPPPPGTPGLFALGGQDVLQGLFQQSGYANITAETIRVPFRLPSVADAVTMMQEAFGAFRAVLADLDPDARAQAWAEIATCLQQFETDAGLRTEIEVMIVSGIGH